MLKVDACLLDLKLEIWNRRLLMGVVNSNMGIQNRLDKVYEELQKLNKRIDNLFLPSTPEVKETTNGVFTLKSLDNMIWWTKDEKAARYRIKLFASANGDDWDEIDVIEVDRERAYWAFSDLPKSIRFKAEVIVENRNGEPIGSALINI